MGDNLWCGCGNPWGNGHVPNSDCTETPDRGSLAAAPPEGPPGYWTPEVAERIREALAAHDRGESVPFHAAPPEGPGDLLSVTEAVATAIAVAVNVNPEPDELRMFTLELEAQGYIVAARLDAAPSDLAELVAALEHANVVIGELRARLDAAPLTVERLARALHHELAWAFPNGVSIVEWTYSAERILAALAATE